MQQSHLLNIKKMVPNLRIDPPPNQPFLGGFLGEGIGVMIIVHVFWPILVFSKLCGSMDRYWLVLKVKVLLFGSAIFEHGRKKIVEIYLIFVRSGVDYIEFSVSLLFWFNPHSIETKEMV